VGFNPAPQVRVCRRSLSGRPVQLAQLWQSTQRAMRFRGLGFSIIEKDIVRTPRNCSSRVRMHLSPASEMLVGCMDAPVGVGKLAWMKIDPVVRKQLDKVVGERFDPPRRPRDVLLKWLLAALLAIGAAAIVMAILHTHLTQAQTAPAPKRPVPIHILPAR
jgi:hypothetical protein